MNVQKVAHENGISVKLLGDGSYVATLGNHRTYSQTAERAVAAEILRKRERVRMNGRYMQPKALANKLIAAIADTPSPVVSPDPAASPTDRASGDEPLAEGTPEASTLSITVEPEHFN